MENIIMDFLYKVRGDFSTNGLQKVFFSFHPDDTEAMEKVANDVLSLTNCAIYYHMGSFSKEEIDLEDYGLKLMEMKLFVVIVTTNYLMNDSLSKNWEYDFAMKNNIPIIPVAVESGLEEFFSVEMNNIGDGYGDIQLLNSQVADKTEMSYKQKLSRDLGAILINDEEVKKIKEAFIGQIFLSYRKKDRKYANELMRTIHSIPALQNVSVWYDEFIVAGEKWDSQIKEALKNSDVFLLMVTPYITEPDNYVIREEYPEAKNQNKKIVSASKNMFQSKGPKKEELERLFPGLDIFIDGDNTTELEEALRELSDSREDSIEKNYLIGLAFFNGIGVERDSKKAVPLIIASAKNGLPEAINKLAEMYWNGDGIAVNFENSILWRKKLVEVYERQFIDAKCFENMIVYIKALESLATCLYKLSAYRESLKYCKQLVELMELNYSADACSEFCYYYAQAYDLCGKINQRLGNYNDALVSAKKYSDFSEVRYEHFSTMINRHNLSVSYGRLGDIYYSIGDFEKAETWYFRAWKIDNQIYEELQSVDAAHSLAASSLVLGDIFVRNGEYDRADCYYVQAVDLRKKILGAENSDERQREYAETIISLGTSLLLRGDIKKAKMLFVEARDIMVAIAEKYGTIESQHACSVALNRCGKICEIEEDFKGALEYYSDSMNRRKRILSRIRTSEIVYEYTLTLYYMSGVYQRLGDDARAKANYGMIVENLLPILSKDRKGDWHRVFAEAAFEWFKIDTFAGKPYLQYAIDAWKWLSDIYPENGHYCKQYEICQKMYQRCYPT